MGAALFGAVDSAAALEWPTTEQTITIAKEQKSVPVVFVFRNSAAIPVRIISAASSCDCLRVFTPENVIEPGATGEIRGQFDAEGKSGVVQRSITIRSDDATEPTELKLTFALVDTIRMEPHKLSWTRDEPPSLKRASINSSASNTVKSLSVQCMSPDFEVALEKASDGRNYSLAMMPKRTDGIIQATVRVNAEVNGEAHVFIVNAIVR